MLRSFLVPALVIAASASAAAQQQPVIRSGTDTVRVYVTVTDRDGRLVTDLTRDQFEVRDEGRPQPITLFDNSPRPIELIVMLDVSGSMEGNLGLLRASVRRLFQALGPDDVGRVGWFGEQIVISPSWTRDLRALDATMPTVIEENAPTPLWQAVVEASAAFEADPSSDRRRVVVVLSDGYDSGPQFGRRFTTQAQAIETARREDVMVYGIGLRSRGGARQRVPMGGNLSDALRRDEPDPGLARTAVETGGGYADVRPGDDLGAAFAAIVAELHSQYLIGFEPPKRDGKKHDLDVRVEGRGLEPRARKSYIAPKG